MNLKIQYLRHSIVTTCLEIQVAAEFGIRTREETEVPSQRRPCGKVKRT
jgi:hypothetical protein